MADSIRGDTLRRLLTRFGFFAAVFAVFACGWFAMRSDDWKMMVLLSVGALLAGTVASEFARRNR